MMGDSFVVIFRKKIVGAAGADQSRTDIANPLSIIGKKL